jgi:hypothetical protein
MNKRLLAATAGLVLSGQSCAVRLNQPTTLIGPIVFSSNRTGRFQLYSCSEDGSNVKLFSESETDDTNPRWSPVGEQLAFIADETLTVLDPATKARHPLDVIADPDVPLSWSRTGDRIICMSGSVLAFVDVATKRVSKFPAGSLHATWMPGSDELLETRGQIPFLQVMSAEHEFIRYFLEGGVRSTLIPQLVAMWSRVDPPRCAFSSTPGFQASNLLAYDVFIATQDGTKSKKVFSADGMDWACWIGHVIGHQMERRCWFLRKPTTRRTSLSSGLKMVGNSI